MARQFAVKVAGDLERARRVYLKVGGVWKRAQNMWLKVSGVWKPFLTPQNEWLSAGVTGISDVPWVQAAWLNEELLAIYTKAFSPAVDAQLYVHNVRTGVTALMDSNSWDNTPDTPSVFFSGCTLGDSGKALFSRYRTVATLGHTFCIYDVATGTLSDTATISSISGFNLSNMICCSWDPDLELAVVTFCHTSIALPTSPRHATTYNPTTNTWTVGAVAPAVVQGLAYSKSRSKHVAMLQPLAGFTRFAYYNAFLGTWSAIFSGPARLSGTPQEQIVQNGDNVYLYATVPGQVPAIWKLDPVADTWTPVTIPELVPDGQLLRSLTTGHSAMAGTQHDVSLASALVHPMFWDGAVLTPTDSVLLLYGEN